MEIVTLYIDDPGGSIPGWLINMATSKMLVLQLLCFVALAVVVPKPAASLSCIIHM